MSDLEKGPVFLFSAGWRSGSTLLQRLITHGGEVMMWGEPFGALDALTRGVIQEELIKVSTNFAR